MTNQKSASRIIAFAGPKGGCGRSTCTAALARALASRDRHVLIVDNNGFAGGLATLVDLPRQNVQSVYTFKPAHTSNALIDIVSITPIRNSAAEIFEHWRTTYDYDDIIIDLRSGFGTEPCDLFLHADFPILIINAEPASIQLATIWLRQVIIRQIETQTDFDELVSNFSDCRDTWDFRTFYPNLSASLQQQLIRSLDSFKCALLLNQRREHSEMFQALALCHAYGLLLGTNIELLGSIPMDDRRWFFARRLADVSLFNREDPLVHEWDVIAREALHPSLFHARPCLALVAPQSQPRQYLRVDTAEESRQAYRQLWEGYRRENGLVSNLFSRDAISEIVSDLELAYRNAEIESQPPKTAPTDTPSTETPIIARSFSNTFAAVKSYDPSSCHPDAGQWLQSQRENAGLTASQLALKTRIPLKIIDNLEHRDLDGISVMRLQAYLYEIARALKLDLEALRHKFGL